MSTELLPNGTLKIEAYSFAEFLSEYQQAVLDGYSLDLETNEHFPQKYGDHLFVILKADQWSHIGEFKVYTELEQLARMGVSVVIENNTVVAPPVDESISFAVIDNTVKTMNEVAEVQDLTVGKVPRKPRVSKE